MRQSRRTAQFCGFHLIGFILGLFSESVPFTAQAQLASLEGTIVVRTVNGIAVPFQNGMPYPSLEKQQRAAFSLNGLWRKQRFAADHNVSLLRRDSTGYARLLAEANNRHRVDYDDGGWAGKVIPAVENTMGASEKTPEYYEDGVWYRRSFVLPDSLNNRFCKMVFTAVNYVADVWLNGHYLGWHEGGYTPFVFDATPYLRFDSSNVVAVRVDNIPWGTRKDIVPYYTCDWFNYAGIIHEVYLEFSDRVSVARADIVPLDVTGAAEVTVTMLNRSSVAQNVEVELEVFTAAIDSSNVQTEKPFELIGAPVIVTGATRHSAVLGSDSTSAWKTAIGIQNPRLWSPKQPNLYILRARLLKGSQVLDEFCTQFGLRTVRTAGDKFLLNDKPAFLPGLARHEDHPSYGRSIPPSVTFSDLKAIKGLNANFLRTAHYPNHPYTYLITDRLGIAALEEIPVWWFDESIAWTIQNDVRHIHEQMWKEMIFRDYNRPSIILWSTSNECKDVTGRKQFIQRVRQELSTSYPDGRLVTQSAAADRPGPWDASQAACDIAGWTMYFGIFHGGAYYEGTRDFLAAAHVQYPAKPVLDTEYGFWSSEDGVNEGRQVKVLDSTFAAFSAAAVVDSSGRYNPAGYLMGATWWCAFDWYTHQNNGGFQSMGVYRMDRTTGKPVASRLRQIYRPYYQNSEIATAVEEKVALAIPHAVSLEQNYPNPFNPSTRIRYSVAETGKVKVVVHNILGQEVRVLEDAVRGPGMYEIEFSAAAPSVALASGIYFCTLTVNGSSVVRKMVLAR